MQAEAAERKGPLQLLDSLDARFNPGSLGLGAQRVVPLPVGFLEDLSAKLAGDDNEEGLKELMRPIGRPGSALQLFLSRIACFQKSSGGLVCKAGG